MKVVEDTLICYYSLNNASSLNISEALIMAAIDENIHLDCVYLLIQREPDILQKLLPSMMPVAAGLNNNNDEAGCGEENDRKSKKRKKNTLGSVLTV